MFPKPALPDTTFAARDPYRQAAFRFGQGFGKALLNQPPPICEIIVTERQSRDRFRRTSPILRNYPALPDFSIDLNHSLLLSRLISTFYAKVTSLIHANSAP
jgi:hypothetical protein